MAAAAKLVHFALYALLIAIPATAVLGTWLEGIPVTLPGFDIAPQIAEAHELGQLIMEIHTTLGNAILWVAGVHAAAALFHHFYLRDEVFQSMTPGGRMILFRQDLHWPVPRADPPTGHLISRRAPSHGLFGRRRRQTAQLALSGPDPLP